MSSQLIQNNPLSLNDARLMNQLAIGVLLVNENGLVTSSNSQFQNKMGFTEVDLKFKKLSDLIHKKDWEKFSTLLKQVQNNIDKNMSKIRVSLLHKNTEPIEARVILSQLSNTGSETPSILIQVTDFHQKVFIEDGIKDVKEFLILISENNQDMVFVKDESLRIVFANKAFLSIYTEEQRDHVIGKTTFESFHADEMEKFVSQDKLAFSTGRTKMVEEITMPTGKKLFLETIKTRFVNGLGEPHILGVSRDVTKTIELVEDLERSNNDLNQFAYVASHDLKSPANAIRQLVDWLEEDCKDILNETGLGHLELLRNRSDRMIMLLDDLLEYSRFNHGNYEIKEFNLKTMVSNILELINPEKQYKIIAEDKNLIVPYTPTEIVLRNLIFNGIKHHDKTTGVIKIMYLEDDPKVYKLLVIDDGPGIPADLTNKALEMFQTLKPRDQVEGSGMGLALVKKIVTSYRATLVLKDANEFTGERGLAVEISWPRSTFTQKEMNA